MLDYYHAGGHRSSHSLNAWRLGATLEEEPYLGSTEVLRTALAKRQDVLLMGNWLIGDLQIGKAIGSSVAHIDLFVAPYPVSASPVQELCSELLLQSGIDPACVLGMYFRWQGLVDVLASKAHRWDVKTHLVERPIVVDEADSLSHHVLGTKGETLRCFEGLLSDAWVDPGVLVSRAQWNSSNQSGLDEVLSQGHPTLIVRSSAVSEDSFASSNAGAYTSVMGIDGRDADGLRQAIQAVFDSCGNGSSLDQVLVQKQITDSVLSGVCTSRVIGRNSPYFVISYDDSSGRTDTVTGGATNEVKTLYVRRTAVAEATSIQPVFHRLLGVMKEIERCADRAALDIEFIVDRSDVIHVVQIRPLVGDYSDQHDQAIEQRVRSSEALLHSRLHAVDGLLQGTKAIFGVMPDANPAELIGIKPKPLAFSLYQRLITDDVVTNQRHEYGYRDVRPIQHMIRLGGSPFIDVRSSFNSLTPKGLRPALAAKLVDLYIDRLESNPDLHDKVEFEIAVSTWFPGLAVRLSERYGHALTSPEIEEVVGGALQVFHSAVSRVDADFDDVEAYVGLLDKVMSSDHCALSKAWRLLGICHHFGCKPFAHLARSAFVAVSVLKGFVAAGVMSPHDYDGYLHSVESVSGAMENDAANVRDGFMERLKFYGKYGHLRPGTYDILSPAYFEDPARYLDSVISSARRVDKSGWALAPETVFGIDSNLRAANVDFTFASLDRFARRAIHGREYGKFAYTRFLSYALDQLISWGHGVGLSRDDLAYLTVRDLSDVLVGVMPGNASTLLPLITSRRREYQIDSHIELPDLVQSQSDFAAFHKRVGQPNFVTAKTVTALVISVHAGSDPGTLALAGKIALIESADPGFDWLFGHEIAGLVTRYGGANSHMAIRCAELGVPAAIGVGELLYDQLCSAPALVLDCVGKRIAATHAA